MEKEKKLNSKNRIKFLDCLKPTKVKVLLLFIYLFIYLFIWLKIGYNTYWEGWKMCQVCGAPIYVSFWNYIIERGFLSFSVFHHPKAISIIFLPFLLIVYMINSFILYLYLNIKGENQK